MKQIIGFATEFYTLWDFETQINYTMNAYGQYFPSSSYTNYYFRKNISKDLNKVKELYPNLPVDDSLRGKSRSFSIENKVELPVEYFWFGKYNGKLIEEILKTDIGYCEWAAREAHYKTREFIKNHPLYIEHCEKINSAKNDRIIKSNPLKVGEEVELTFVSNGYMTEVMKYDEQTGDSLDFEEICYARAVREDSECEFYVRIKDYKRVGGMYPYIMPNINGKCQKTKGKKYTVKVVEVEEPFINNYNKVIQTIFINS